MENDNYMYNDYLKRFNTANNYNFDLNSMIENFDLESYFADAPKNAKDSNNYAFLVITNNQYLLGYNSSFGSGGHIGAFARVMMDVYYDGKSISNFNEASILANRLSNIAITARMNYENISNDYIYNKYKFKGSINFNFVNKYFTSNQLNVFKNFYEEYNEKFKKICNKYDFNIVLEYLDKDGKHVCNNSNNLDQIYEYIKSHIKNNSINISENIIIKNHREI